MHPSDELSAAKFRQAVQTALKQWQDHDAAQALADWRLFRQFQQQDGRNLRHTANQLLLHGLTQLEKEHPKRARTLRLRYLEGYTVQETANHLNLEEPTIFNLQRDGIDHLARVLYQAEVQARTRQYNAFEQRLDAPTYTHLIGVEAHFAQLLPLLTTPGAPWLVAVEGIGGIGKTALADALLRQLLREPVFADFGWVTARRTNFDLGGGLQSLAQPALTTAALVQQLVTQLFNDHALLTVLPFEKQVAALQARLKQTAHLIVIDNLETLSDVEALFPLLPQLSNPTKFLLTSRLRFVTEAGIYHFTVPPLSEKDALRLVRQEATLSNVAHLATASDDELRPIYATVGGNPLALRLIVGQSYFEPLALILADLVAAHGSKVENLYTYIYRRAWDSLDETTRQVWLALPLLIGRNATLENLSKVTALESRLVRPALEKLICLHLVDCHGALNERSYSLHSLTRTFLQEQVGQWL